VLRRRFAFDLVHAHYAAPAGDAVVRARPGVPLVVSVHGGDVLAVPDRWPRHGGPAVRRALGAARLVLANSRGTLDRARALGAVEARVVHLGTDPPATAAPEPDAPVLVTVANLVARKRHADVLEALAHLPGVVWEIVGDGPERGALEQRAAALGLGGRVRFHGHRPPDEAVALARRGTAFVLPSVDEAFGVAYVEAMAAGVPAVGCRGEPGPEEIAGRGGGMRLVPPRDPAALAAALRDLLAADRRPLRAAARETVARHFTWARCGERTVEAYAEALR
jgi:glycosyltransferase involved in cell wall biosynthesis